MMKFQPGIILFAICILILPARSGVKAQRTGQCDPGLGVADFSSGGEYGFEITRAEKTYPNYPIIVTQEETHTGVNIVVEIQSYPGRISYEAYSEPCVGFDKPQKGLVACAPYYSMGEYYYLQPTCTPVSEPVFRYIEGNSLKVWLEPTADTKRWLGWDTETLDEGKYPLRYLFPEKWSLGTWTPEGFTTEGDVGMWTEEEIKKFIAEHPGYNFLKADPRHTEIPTQYLPLAADPLVTDTLKVGSRVIPLFGDGFAIWNGLNPVTAKNGCLIDGAGPDGQGYCAKTVNDRTDPLFGSVDLAADNITYLSVSFAHIPMDLPGEWYIAVEVRVRPAVYDGGRIESTKESQYFYRIPNYGFEYRLSEHTFVTYMWISTPCNPAELHGCEN